MLSEGLDVPEDPAIGRTLSGGHLRAGSALPGKGIELVPPLCGTAPDLRKKISGCLFTRSRVYESAFNGFYTRLVQWRGNHQFVERVVG